MTDVSTDWVLPFRLERARDPDAGRAPVAISTPVGTIASTHQAVVDQRGLVTPRPGGWSLDWWVGADDRWHLPSREVAVRQRLVDDMPVIETAMRIPTGDAVQRVFGVRHGDDELVIVEIENRSKLPVALVLAVRPYDADGEATIDRVGLRDGVTVIVDGGDAMRLPRPPSRTALSTSAEGDVASIVFRGDAGDSTPVEVRDGSGRASAAFIFPLAHTATMRVALPVPGGRVARVPDAVSAEQVARGWRAHVGRGTRVVIPDAAVQASVDAERASLLLRTPHRLTPDEVPSALRALDRFGHGRDVADALRFLPVDLATVAEHWRLHRDIALVHELTPAIAAAAEAMARRGGSARALHDAAVLLEAVGETRAAADARWLAAGLPDGDGAAEPPELDLVSVREMLVREVDDGLALCTRVPAEWLGQGIEVHDAPTHRGALSYAVRWHGDRPALLWELVPHDGLSPCRLTAPGLDPTWSSAELSGDALLAAVAVPGLVTPVRLRRP